jgi:hypothetical protein
MGNSLTCECNESGCIAAHDSDVQFELELSDDGNTLTGPFEPDTSGYSYSRLGGARWQAGVSIYLQRVEE